MIDLKNNKHDLLYMDAKERKMRKEKLQYINIDKNCTFKPTLVANNSKLSLNIVREVHDEVKEKLISNN
jgi:hypothetical protein